MDITFDLYSIQHIVFTFNENLMTKLFEIEIKKY